MPHIAVINIQSNDIVQGSPGRHEVGVYVTAKINFSDVEKRIGLNYHATIALYEVEGTMDVYTAFPNNHQLFLQRADRGGKDGFIGFSNTKKLSARTGTAEIKHTFTTIAAHRNDGYMDFKALVICVPETATAMQWSSTKKVQVIAG